MLRAREEQERDLCDGLILIELIEDGGDDEMDSMAFQLPATSPVLTRRLSCNGGEGQILKRVGRIRDHEVYAGSKRRESPAPPT